MKVSIKAENRRFTIPVPLSMGSLFIRLISSEQMSKEQKKFAIMTFKVIKKSLKEYKGMTIVEVDSSSGEHIKITV